MGLAIEKGDCILQLKWLEEFYYLRRIFLKVTRPAQILIQQQENNLPYWIHLKTVLWLYTKILLG